MNRPSGRSDFEALGRRGTVFEGKGWVLEFKHFSAKEAKRLGVADWRGPRPEDVEQVQGYANSVRGL